MRLRVRTRVLATMMLLGSLVVSAYSQELGTTLAKEIQRLKTIAATQPKTDADWKDVEPSFSQHLTRAEQALKAGRSYYALQSIGEANVELESFLSIRQNAATLENLNGFESKWKQTKLELAAENSRARERKWAGIPAVVRALSEAAQGQSLTVLDASHAYAQVTDPSAGFYYLGEARGDAGFATFAYNLNASTSKPARQLRAVSPEIDALQRRTVEIFKPPLSQNKHKQFIGLNSTIKLAQELDAANLRFGALYEYLFAVQQLALMETDTAPTSNAELEKKLAAANARLSNSKNDDSIAELFLQKTQAMLDPRADALGDADQKTRTATALLDRVLPAYYAYVEGPAPSLPKPDSVVTVTLVRWPYT